MAQKVNIKCSDCGAPIAVTDEKCPYCGAPNPAWQVPDTIYDEVIQPTTTPATTSSASDMGCGCLFILVAIALGLYLFLAKPNKEAEALAVKERTWIYSTAEGTGPDSMYIARVRALKPVRLSGSKGSTTVSTAAYLQIALAHDYHGNRKTFAEVKAGDDITADRDRMIGDSLTAQFDDHALQAFKITPGYLEAYITSSDSFIEQVKASKKLKITATFETSGTHEMEFNTSNLVWVLTK